MLRFLATGVVMGVLLAAGAARAADEATPAKSNAPNSDAANDSAYTQRLKEVRLIEIHYLRSTDEKEFQKGREKLLAIKDEAAVKPMVQVLYTPNARYRGLLTEALGQFAATGSRVAQAYLQEVAVGDAVLSHRRKAVENLKGWTGDPPTDRLMSHLATDKVPEIRDRAAQALAQLNEKRAIWFLVEQLVTEETRLVGAEVRDAQVTLDIRAQQCDTPVFRRYPITAAVPGGGVAQFIIELPEVAVTDVATTVAMGDRAVIPDIKRVKIEHPEILAALKALTGKDFGYNQAAWQQWLQSADAAKILPPWQPQAQQKSE
jgi:hypothetical protein